MQRIKEVVDMFKRIFITLLLVFIVFFGAFTVRTADAQLIPGLNLKCTNTNMWAGTIPAAFLVQGGYDSFSGGAVISVIFQNNNNLTPTVPYQFNFTEAQTSINSILSLLSGLYSLWSPYADILYLTPQDLYGLYDGATVASIINGAYLSWLVDVHIVIEIWKYKWGYLPVANQRMDIYVDDGTGSCLVYGGSVEIRQDIIDLLLGGGLGLI